MISQSDRERELYQSRLKMRRDMNAVRDEGRAEGRAEERRAFIRSLQAALHEDAMSMEQLEAFSLPELESLMGRLQAELNVKLSNRS